MTATSESPPAPHAAEEAAEETYPMELTRPITVGGVQVSELRLKDPGSAALDGIEMTLGPKGATFDLGSLPRLIAAAAGIPLEAARTIRIGDTVRHAQGILGFFGLDTPGTGAAPA